MLKKLFMFMIAMALSAGAAYAAPADLPETGQTKCYDSNNPANEIACANTGQDGELKKGIAWPSPRFTVSDCGTPADSSDDVITDNLTGLMWVRTPDSTTRTWANALTYANGLSLCGYDNWRLPNVNELESLINAEQANTATWLNLPAQGFSYVQAGGYWSSSTYAYDPTHAWIVDMNGGHVSGNIKASSYYVWPVRAGQ